MHQVLGLVAILGVSQLLLAPTPLPEAGGLLIRVVLHLQVPFEDRTLARETAQALLASSGITVSWDECSVLVSRCDPLVGAELLVRLMPTNVTGSGECGSLTRGPGGASVALIHVLRHRELVRRIHRSPAARSHPGLFSLQAGHVTGLAIAHEVGHALGLPHAERGVMKHSLAVDDLIGLRQSRLAFTPEQATRMRVALQPEVASVP